MTVQELKAKILSNTLDNTFLILKSDNNFIGETYIRQICKDKNLIYTPLESSSDLLPSALSLVLDTSDQLRVLKVDTLILDHTLDLTSLQNVIILCTNIVPECLSFTAKYTVEIPKLTDWQIKAYIQSICPKLTFDEVTWLYKTTASSIYYLQTILDMLLLFPAEEQSKILAQLRIDPNSLLFTETFFDVSNAILAASSTNKLYLLLKVLPYVSRLNFSALGLASNLLQNYKNILLLTETALSATELGIKESQAAVLRTKYANQYSLKALQKLIQFLSEIDLKIKLGQLDLSNQTLIDYIIVKIQFILREVV